MFKFTPRALRLIGAAESAIHMTGTLLTPVDLFVGGLYERTGVLGEFFVRGRFNFVRLQENTVRSATTCEAGISLSPFVVDVSSSVVGVLQKADELRRSYRQVQITEGHIYSALLDLNEVNELLQCSDSGITKRDIQEIVCSPRDMTVRLQGFLMPESSVLGEVMFRRAIPEERDSIVSFVRQEFGDRWVSYIINGFDQADIPIFVALAGIKIVGFACYDVVRMKRGVFGPMGTSLDRRQKGIGKALLHHCLSEMQRIGYDYAIINNAGPIEFYETSCGAVVIPKSNI